MPEKRRPAPPKAGGGAKFIADVPPADDTHPVWCFRYLNSDFGFGQLEHKGREAFLSALFKRSQLIWRQLLLAPRHGLGPEQIPVASCSVNPPPGFADRDTYMVFRYDGKKPFGGFRVERIFHVVWIEREFGEVYSHGE